MLQSKAVDNMDECIGIAAPSTAVLLSAMQAKDSIKRQCSGNIADRPEEMPMPTASSRSFDWSSLGDISTGRPNLGSEMPVLVYRLMQQTMRDYLSARFSEEVAGDVLRESGRLAGMAFCRNLLDCSLSFNKFMAQLQNRLQQLRIGILRIEHFNPDTLEAVMTVSEDLDCSGLPVSGNTVCEYDEGFIAGLMEAYSGKPFNALEVDCWATGERTCRFKINPATPS